MLQSCCRHVCFLYVLTSLQCVSILSVNHPVSQWMLIVGAVSLCLLLLQHHWTSANWVALSIFVPLPKPIATTHCSCTRWSHSEREASLGNHLLIAHLFFRPIKQRPDVVASEHIHCTSIGIWAPLPEAAIGQWAEVVLLTSTPTECSSVTLHTLYTSTTVRLFVPFTRSYFQLSGHSSKSLAYPTFKLLLHSLQICLRLRLLLFGGNF